MAERVPGSTVVKKKNTKSPVWLHFGLKATEDGAVIVDEQEKPICRACGRSVLAKGGNTTNLFQHLKEHHPALYAEVSTCSSKKGECSSSTQLTLSESIEKSQKYSSASPQSRELNRAVAYYLAREARPLSTVDKPGFKYMVAKLNPRYQLPSRKYFSNTEIPQLFHHVKDYVVLPKLREAEYYAGTTDMWTSAACEPYMSFTVHLIDRDWNLHSFCLDTVAVFEDHTGHNIAEAVMDILANWELPLANLVATTTDNGSNIILAFEILEQVRISCFGHNLDLAIKKGLRNDRVQRVLGKCHSLVGLFHRSWKKCRDLRAKQQQLDLPQHKLKSDVATRWGSTYEMAARIVEQLQPLSAVLAEDRKTGIKC